MTEQLQQVKYKAAGPRQMIASECMKEENTSDTSATNHITALLLPIFLFLCLINPFSDIYLNL